MLNDDIDDQREWRRFRDEYPRKNRAHMASFIAGRHSQNEQLVILQGVIDELRFTLLVDGPDSEKVKKALDLLYTVETSTPHDLLRREAIFRERGEKRP